MAVYTVLLRRDKVTVLPCKIHCVPSHGFNLTFISYICELTVFFKARKTEITNSFGKILFLAYSWLN